jgi:hypothetical protein
MDFMKNTTKMKVNYKVLFVSLIFIYTLFLPYCYNFKSKIMP